MPCGASHSTGLPVRGEMNGSVGMAGLLFYLFDSCGRLHGGRCGLVLFGCGQLGPDQVPVIGAQVAARHGAASGSLDGDAGGGVRRCAARAPVADSGLRHADHSGHCGDAAQVGDGQI